MLSRTSQANYVASNGTHCPHCGGDLLEGRDITINTGEATQTVMCLDCDEDWTDVYQLTGLRLADTLEASQ